MDAERFGRMFAAALVGIVSFGFLALVLMLVAWGLVKLGGVLF